MNANNLKDNVASAAVLLAILVSTLSGAFVAFTEVTPVAVAGAAFLA